MNGLDYYTRQCERYNARTEKAMRPTRQVGDLVEFRYVYFYRDGRPDLSPIERLELGSLQRELAVLLPSYHS